LAAFALVLSAVGNAQAQASAVDVSNEDYQLSQLRETVGKALVQIQDRRFQKHEAYSVVVDYPRLAMKLLGKQNTARSRELLVSFMMFRLDGSVAEDHTCEVLGLKSSVQQVLKRAQSADLRARCLSMASQLSLPSDALCASPETIQRRLSSLLEATNAGRACQ
jgi:hypothetical protein